MWITLNERGKIDLKETISTPQIRRDDKPMFWVKSEKAISVIFVFDLRKGGTLIFTRKRSFWMRLQINTYLNYIARYDAMNKSRNPWPEVLCKYELLNFKVLKIERNPTSDRHWVFDISSWTFETYWRNLQPNFPKLNVISIIFKSRSEW